MDKVGLTPVQGEKYLLRSPDRECIDDFTINVFEIAVCFPGFPIDMQANKQRAFQEPGFIRVGVRIHPILNNAVQP